MILKPQNIITYPSFHDVSLSEDNSVQLRKILDWVLLHKTCLCDQYRIKLSRIARTLAS